MSQLSLSPPLAKVTIRLLDPTDSHEIKRRNFQLVEGRLRIQQIQDYFQIKHLEWKEEDVILGVRSDGLSDNTFNGGELISIVNEEALAQDGADVIVSFEKKDSNGVLQSDPSVRAIQADAEREQETRPRSATEVQSGDTQSEGTGWKKARATTLPPNIDALVHPPLHRRQHSINGGNTAVSRPQLNLQVTNPHGKRVDELRGNFSNRNSSVLIGACKVLQLPEDSTPSAPEEFDFKLIVVGDINCGKTSIIRRYVSGKFSKGYKATIGVDFSSKDFIASERLNVRLQLWDVAGQERFGTFTRVYFQGAVGGMVVFDLTDPKTSAAVVKWKQDIDSKITLENGMPLPVILVGNKSDLMTELAPIHTPEYLDKMCAEHGFVAWFTTSCVLDRNVKEAFQYLGNTVLENDRKFPSLREEDKKAIKLNKRGQATETTKSGCCQN